MSPIPLKRARRISRRVHLSVQNIIYNEMGLSRKTIELQIKNAVEDRALKLAGDGDMLNLADRVIMRRIQHYKYAPPQIEKMVQAAIAKAVEEHVMVLVKKHLDGGLKISIGKGSKA